MRLRLKQSVIERNENGLLSCRYLDGDSVDISNSYNVFPGFADVHVHLREPGFSYT